ncbi:hypothetical protein [Aeromicrobium endophyticum]|uniref:Uncharacterized protein n=1 Tax=Aeromicrobium endophyticum TaxID=2292704 RepID=A0A371P1S1_9ACTN|nr:hypothetical protein [Aeromicrobium endophyticum]REK69841.1 hypothetical protein DX116_11650 [Aeromicrobium endophyticum]
MKRILIVFTALVGLGLVAGASTVLVEGADRSGQPEIAQGPTAIARPAGGDAQPAVDVEDAGAVRVVDPMLVVNKDGSAAVGAFADNSTSSDVTLMGVAVWVDRQPVRVSSTEMWLPVLAGDRSQVGAASDAGGFVLPSGIVPGASAEIAFRFDDGTCVLADVAAVARSDEHDGIYPTSNRPIGPVTGGAPPPRSTPCGSDQDDTTS